MLSLEEILVFQAPINEKFPMPRDFYAVLDLLKLRLEQSGVGGVQKNSYNGGRVSTMLEMCSLHSK